MSRGPVARRDRRHLYRSDQAALTRWLPLKGGPSPSIATGRRCSSHTSPTVWPCSRRSSARSRRRTPRAHRHLGRHVLRRGDRTGDREQASIYYGSSPSPSSPRACASGLVGATAATAVTIAFYMLLRVASAPREPARPRHAGRVPRDDGLPRRLPRPGASEPGGAATRPGEQRAAREDRAVAARRLRAGARRRSICGSRAARNCSGGPAGRAMAELASSRPA